MTNRILCNLLTIAVLALFGCTGNVQSPIQSQPLYGYRVVNTYPHDSQAYTQGLVFRDGFLFESTGLNGRSSLRKVKLETGEVLQQEHIDPQYFAEGLTDWGGQLVQLTWQSNVGFVYDLATLGLQRMFRLTGEGWGLTHDGSRLIVSDGTDTLRFLDPATFQARSQVSVRDGGVPVKNLNELEYVRGEIYANVWHTNSIARISPESGRVVGWIDLAGILPGANQLDSEAVLNGIAFDSAQDRLFVTGKLWPKLFEIKLERRQ
ncbi:glutaminyl-peptide cyclotransferase [Armatimonas sp.]|uniref:glutaminyl-peptide cyclotransferase n=1 Tax=Armatimonas sp. TaxID=1872638 RepID=UPI003751B204